MRIGLVVTFLISFCGYIDAADIPKVESAIIIDHNCTEISRIPMEWIDAAKEKIKLHYAHTSHGGQILEGMKEIVKSEPGYSFARKEKGLPVTTDSLAIFDGQENDAYISPRE